jgi:uncharacterized membrane protein (DUF485 family)
MIDFYDKIYADPEFQKLQSQRSRFSWGLAALTLVDFYIYILVIAFKPAWLAVPLHANTVITWGIPVAVGIILLGFVLTGIYVWRANNEFDVKTAAIVKRVGG